MKDPLTRDDLVAIKDRNPGDPDVIALLWEIHRLRALTLRTHDYFRQTSTSSMAIMLEERLRRDLAAEPVVNEQQSL